jgi:hypothetical protein
MVHPDRFVGFPADKEVEMSNVVIQPLNGLVDASGSEQDTMAQIKR